MKYHERDGDTVYLHFGLLQLGIFESLFSTVCLSCQMVCETEDRCHFDSSFLQIMCFCFSSLKPHGNIWHSLPFPFAVLTKGFNKNHPSEALFCHPLGHHPRRAECEVYAENKVRELCEGGDLPHYWP